jgi:glycerol-3-phosphate acyltransferase PlsY
LIGLAAIIGHDFPIFLRGHGGKGIATSLGVITALAPPVGVIGIIFWWIVILATRYASLASLVMLLVCSIVMPLYDYAFLTDHHYLFSVFVVALFVVALWQHRANIDRLIHGTELKLSSKTEEQPS